MRATSCLHALLFAILCVLAAGIRPAAACSCVRTETPCEAYTSSPVVFVGDVVSVEETGGQFHMRLRVVRAYKGMTDATADLWSDARSSCGVRLDEGARYVIYTRLSEGRMSLHACGYGKQLAPGEPVPELPPVAGRLYGTVARYDVDRIRDFKPLDPIASVRIGLDLPSGRATATSDQWGRFTFSGLTPGTYQFSVDAGQGLTPWMPRPLVVSDRDACVETEIVLQPSGKVSGRVVTADGKPAALVWVRLIPDGPAGNRSVLSTLIDLSKTTDPDGRFTIDGLSPGSYLVAVNPEGADTTARQPYRPAWFGGTDRASATRLAVGEGSTIELDRPFVLPAALPTRTFTIAVTCRDGSVPPAIMARALTSDARWADFDETGHGPVRTLNLMRDKAYTLAVSIFVPKGLERRWPGERREEKLPPIDLPAGAPGRHIALVARLTACAETAR